MGILCSLIGNIGIYFKANCKNLLTDIIAFQPSVGKDVSKSDSVTEDQPLIDWDQIREDALKWEKKKWAGQCCILSFICSDAFFFTEVMPLPSFFTGGS